MILKEINVSFRRTYNLGNYESAVFEAGMKAELEDADSDLDLCFEILWNNVKRRVEEQYKLTFTTNEPAKDTLTLNIGKINSPPEPDIFEMDNIDILDNIIFIEEVGKAIKIEDPFGRRAIIGKSICDVVGGFVRGNKVVITARWMIEQPEKIEWTK